MAKLRKPLPFPFASAREKRAHQIRTELQPGMGRKKTGLSNAQIGHSRGHQPTRFGQDSDREAGEGSTTNNAFFGDTDRLQNGQRDEAENQQEGEERVRHLVRGKRGGKTPAMRLKKKVRGLDLEVLDGLIAPPTRSRMRIRSLNPNTKSQTSPKHNDVAPPQPPHVVDFHRALLIPAIYVAVLLLLNPSRTLHLTLTILMFVAPFPEWMPWWTALLTMVLPMGLQARFGVTSSLCMVVWLGGLEWGDAWRGVGGWVWEG